MRKPRKPNTPVPPVVHQFLSRNGKRGGVTTRRLIELGRKQAERTHEDIEREVEQEINGNRKTSK